MEKRIVIYLHEPKFSSKDESMLKIKLYLILNYKIKTRTFVAKGSCFVVA